MSIHKIVAPILGLSCAAIFVGCGGGGMSMAYEITGATSESQSMDTFELSETGEISTQNAVFWNDDVRVSMVVASGMYGRQGIVDFNIHDDAIASTFFEVDTIEWHDRLDGTMTMTGTITGTVGGGSITGTFSVAADDCGDAIADSIGNGEHAYSQQGRAFCGAQDVRNSEAVNYELPSQVDGGSFVFTQPDTSLEKAELALSELLWAKDAITTGTVTATRAGTKLDFPTGKSIPCLVEPYTVQTNTATVEVDRVACGANMGTVTLEQCEYEVFIFALPGSLIRASGKRTVDSCNGPKFVGLAVHASDAGVGGQIVSVP